MKTIFLNSYRSHAAKQRSGAHALANSNDDPAGGATPAVLPVPATDAQIMATAERPHRPWLIQGMMGAL
jgi:hypothetical protein